MALRIEGRIKLVLIVPVQVVAAVEWWRLTER